MTSRIACSPLTGRILLGRLNKEQNAFTGEPKDVTNDFCRAVLDMADFHSDAFQIQSSDGDTWSVTVEKTQAAAKEKLA